MKTPTSSLTPFPETAPPARRMSPGLLAYRLRCLSDDLSRLACAVPAAEGQTLTDLLRARDAIWFAAQRIKSAACSINPQLPTLHQADAPHS